MHKLKEQVNFAQAKFTQQVQANVTRKKINKELEQALLQRDEVEVCINELKNILKICKIFLSKKREHALKSINDGIMTANAIIPDAEKFHLEIGEKTAQIVNEQGIEVYDSEGSAYASLISFYTRYAIVTNTQAQKFLLLDEVLATLSPESSANLSTVLPSISKNMLLILIEQKPEVFANGVDVAYHVTKNNDRSEVLKCI